MDALHRIRTPFLLVNALLMAGFGLGACALPEPFWGLFGVTVQATGVVRLMGWYLFVFGLGGLLAARHPERHPVAVALIGIEKLGPALVFPLLHAQHQANLALAGIGAFDALMAAVFLRYAAWLRTHDKP